MKPIDPADDARGEQHFVPDIDLFADLQLALSALALRPDQEHVADHEQQNDEDQRERAAGLLCCSHPFVSPAPDPHQFWRLEGLGETVPPYRAGLTDGTSGVVAPQGQAREKTRLNEMLRIYER